MHVKLYRKEMYSIIKDKIIMQVITKIKIKKNFVNLHGRNKCDIDNDSIRENMFNEKRIYKTIHRSYE